MIMKVNELLNELLKTKEIKKSSSIVIHNNGDIYFGFVDETPTRFLNRNVEKYVVEKRPTYSKITIDLCNKSKKTTK